MEHLADDVEDEVAKLVAKRVKVKADEEVQRYILSDEFKAMVDTMKRRERERIFTEVQCEIEAEKVAMLASEREKLKLQRQMELDAEQILLQNKLKIEEQRRRDYELKIKQDAERLEEIRRKQQLEVSFIPYHLSHAVVVSLLLFVKMEQEQEAEREKEKASSEALSEQSKRYASRP